MDTHTVFILKSILGLVKHMVVLNIGYFMHTLLTYELSIGKILWYNQKLLFALSKIKSKSWKWNHSHENTADLS